MKDISTFRKWFKASEKELEALYFEFLRYPTISADPVFRPELQACAKWLSALLKNAGFELELWDPDGAPTIFASYTKAGPTKPTLLIYNHYDVQPVDPIELWESKPFQPKRKGNIIVARGAQDNKGQCFYTVSALMAVLKETGSLPINVKMVIEGEEESGSTSLSRHIQEQKEKLKADYLLIVDVGMPNPHTPAVTLGTRGITSMTVEVQGSNSDLHSGMTGGIVYNPLHALVAILASLRDENGHIAIPGFYDAVAVPTASELKELTMHFDEKQFYDEHGCLPTGGEKGFSPIERNWFRPTIEINGITGGYGGPGTKTVIPAKAQAKLSCRLVPHQDPKCIAEHIKRYIDAKAPAGVTVTCTIHEGMGKPVRTSAHSPLVKALSASCKEIFAKPCACILDGASIPIIAELQVASESEVCLFGLGLATDKIHAPNEHFSWDRIENGYVVIADLLYRLQVTS